ncbi:hypothetical protein L208DRAFT_1275016, partial [Tricholoma matsutake]
TTHLDAFLQVALHTRQDDDLLFITILSCAFYACHQIGELVPATPPLFDWRKIIKVQYLLPYHKGDPFYHGSNIIIISQDIADPGLLLRAYTQLCDHKHGACSPLFIQENGSHPSCAWFDHRFFTLLDCSHGGQLISSRAGGATFYASLGILEDVLQALGRWSSSAWKIYIRDHPTIRMEHQLAMLRIHSFFICASRSPPSDHPHPTHTHIHSLIP